jgi:hypothetical protein
MRGFASLSGITTYSVDVFARRVGYRYLHAHTESIAPGFENALLVLRRWYPQREIVAVADRAYASLKLLDQCRKLSNPITFIPRLRLDAALYEPAPPRRPVR